MASLITYALNIMSHDQCRVLTYVISIAMILPQTVKIYSQLQCCILCNTLECMQLQKKCLEMFAHPFHISATDKTHKVINTNLYSVYDFYHSFSMAAVLL